MKKHKKTPHTNGQQAPIDAQATYEMALRYLHDEIAAVINGTAPKTRHDPGYRVATLTKMIAQVDGERRKARALESKRLEKVTRQVVIAWLRAADSDERRGVAREIAAMEQEGSILA